jgi:hypothetical protein
MITGDLDLERTVWDVEYRRQVIAFLADQSAGRTDKPAANRPAGAGSAEIIPFPRQEKTPTAGLRRAVES